MNKVYFIKFGGCSNHQDYSKILDDINTLNPEIIVWDYIREYDIFFNEILNDFNNFLDSKNIDLYVFLGIEKQDIVFEKYGKYNKFKFIFIPQYFFNSIYHTQLDTYKLIKEDIDKRVYEKLFICLNNHIKPHRSMTIDKLCKSNLLDYGVISWLIKDDHLYDFKCWEQKIVKIDDTHEYDSGANQHWLSMNNGNPLVNLVTETICNNHNIYFFLTEKTAKPLLLGQIFLVVSIKGFHSNLKKYGFELYDEIFDYDFDNEESLDKRLDGIMSNLIRIKDMNYYDLYLKVKDKLEKNISTAIKIIEENTTIPQEFYVLYEKYKEDFDWAFENDKLKKFYYK